MNTITKQLFFGAMVLLFTFSNNTFGQTGKLEQANELYKSLAYIEAAKMYLELAESGFQPVEVLQNLGNTYYYNADYKNASKWYGKLFSKTNNLPPLYYLRYAQSLKVEKNDSLAAKYFDSFFEKTNRHNRSFTNAVDYMKIIEENESTYKIKLLDINTEEIDFGTAFLDNTIVFSSTKELSDTKKESAWDGYSYLNLYQAAINKDGTLGETKKLFSKNITANYHESGATFTKDGKTMYFTRSNSRKGSKKAIDKIVHLKIYRAHLIDGEWTNIEDLSSINSNNSSSAYPVLNDKEDLLFFASNGPGSIGETDIFVSRISADGTLGSPRNLGPEINTIGRESFPFISSNNELYFSSDGHFGLGGYDVFYVKLDENKIGNLINVGAPINSSFDDHSFAIQDKKGYVSSNRDSGFGKDDIYFFQQLEPLEVDCWQFVKGVVRDNETKALLPGTLVTLNDDQDVKIESMVADDNAGYTFKLDCDKSYNIVGTKPNYEAANETLTTTSESDITNKLNLMLDPVEIIVDENSGNYLVNVNPIYFDLDKSFIRPDAARELDKVVRIMNKYPDLKIVFGSHTDSRASDKYNWDLSNRRAKSTIEWILNKGIDPLRISGKGYGETQLVNKCSNGVRCSEADHQLNRRSEFVIVNPEAIK